jgi:cytoskeleton protein RodZ
MSAATASDLRSGIGARLKAGRERMGLTLLQVAEKLHLDPKVIESLEADRFEDLGAPVYVRGHIKRYAELISENGVELLGLYSAMTKPVMPDLTQLPKAPQPHIDPKKLVLPSLVVLIAFAVVGSVWWILENVESAPAVRAEEVPAGADAEAPPLSTDGTDADSNSAPANGAASAGAPPTSSTGAPNGASASTPSAGAPPGATAAPGAPSPTPPASAPASASSAASTRAPESGGALTQTPAPSSAARAQGASSLTHNVVGQPPPKAGTTAGSVSSAVISKASLARDAAAAAATNPTRARAVNVTLKFKADSWVEVYDAAGQRLFYDIGAANSSHALSGTPPLRVVLGNAPSVSLNINGKSATVPAGVMQDSGAQFTINRSGRIVRTRPDGG